MAGDLPVGVDLTGDLRTYIAVETDTAGLGIMVDLEGELPTRIRQGRTRSSMGSRLRRRRRRHAI